MVDQKYRGIFPPIMTPLNPDESVDKPSLRRLVSFLLANGVHGIWAAGTNGEFACITDRDRIAAIETIVSEVNGRVPVIANIGDASTRRAVELGLAIKDSGADAIAATPPYYFSNSQDELEVHFRLIHDKVGKPLFVYNIPGTVKVAVNPSTLIRMAKEGSIVGLKDSSGQGERHAELVLDCELQGVEMVRFLAGRCRISTCGRVGGHGIITGLLNIFPAHAVKAWELGEAGKYDEARKYDELIERGSKVTSLNKSGSGNSGVVGGLKAALKVMGIIDHDTVTMPHRPLSEEEKAQIPVILKSVGVL